MSEIDDGGQAYPIQGYMRTIYDNGDSYQESVEPVDGATLRDYFAAKAPPMPEAFLASDPWTGKGHLQCLTVASKHAFWAFRFADAMIAERDREAP